MESLINSASHVRIPRYQIQALTVTVHGGISTTQEKLPLGFIWTLANSLAVSLNSPLLPDGKPSDAYGSMNKVFDPLEGLGCGWTDPSSARAAFWRMTCSYAMHMKTFSS